MATEPTSSMIRSISGSDGGIIGGDDGTRWPPLLSSSSSSCSSSSSRPAAGRGAPSGKRLTPESDSESGTGSEDGDDWEGREGGAEGYELVRRGPGKLDEVDGARLSEGTRRRRRQLYTAEEEQAVVRKFDRRLVAFVALLYLLSFLDRSNIGNARVAGMDDDLQSTPPREDWYEWSLAAFYVAYIVFEWMSLLWRLIPAHIYVTALVLSWGVAASLQAVAVSYPMLIVLRALLGVGEAGFTGVPFYLSFFFKPDELAFRTAIFISAAPLATSFASSLAWLILKLAESVPIAPWRLLFLIEGFPSILVAALAWHIIPDSPQTAPYLTRREKKVAHVRLQTEHHSPPSSSSALAVLTDPAAWLSAAILFLANLAYSSLPVFLPTILAAAGHTALSAQALSAPPYLAAFFSVLATAHLSDRTRLRSPFLIAHALASAAGYTVLSSSSSSNALRYAAVYPAAMGFFNVVVLTIAWSINNQRGAARRGAGFALMQVVGQCGPLVGTRLYPDRDAPYYARGMAVRVRDKGFRYML
ncbi:MFS general substrate transporter [Parathielavia hyrcaniae]|uniref:MFS general substrate transporter n=1 Tax=Parathielavia hyrcaniae TaxID=113614 RepID=A0AAN6Q574_9PEZI|nr:MFS general substrate transporter [Parathielavia hyrcaniae]